MTNTTIHDDCLEIMPTLPDKSIDMILCDLPYGTTACKWDTVIPFEPLWAEYKRIIKDNGAIVLTASQPFTSALVMSNVRWFKAVWYWRKERGTNFVQAKRYPMRVIEECVLFCEGTPLYNPLMLKVKPYSHVLPKPKNGESQHMDSNSVNDDGTRMVKMYNEAYPVNVLDIPRDNMSAGNSFHPTQKPVALFEYLIKTYTNEGDTVLDNCAGSGTTAIACMNTNRNYILIEKEKEYIDIINKRIAEHEQQLTIGVM